MINSFFISGEVKRIDVSEARDNKPASAVLLVQYGVTRESTGGKVEFVNAVQIRVPSYKYPKIADKLKEGQQLQITGKLQGVYKNMVGGGYFTTELVADKIDIIKSADAS